MDVCERVYKIETTGKSGENIFYVFMLIFILFLKISLYNDISLICVYILQYENIVRILGPI